MVSRGVDPALLKAWLSGRSLARGLPPPVEGRGGFRIDTHSEAEVCRWVFPDITPGLVGLGRSIRAPRLFLKLCAEADALRSVLPPGWQVDPPHHFMRCDRDWNRRHLPKGYAIESVRRDALVQVRILADDGTLAASGYGAETSDAFVYDRIVTAPDHRRRGLGHAVMTALKRAKRSDATPDLLVATDEGLSLYALLGWRVLTPYSTASFVGA